jgi:hypothetical protein
LIKASELEGVNMKKYCLWIGIIGLFGLFNEANAAWSSTGFTAVDIRMDNGVTYFYPNYNGSLSYPLNGNCMYSRLELRDTGDRFNSAENGKRMMALILSARLVGKLVSLGYDDTDGPGCRIAQVIVQW